MAGVDFLAPVNSRQWWEDYFAEQWERHQGRAQTAHFMTRLIASLPWAERNYLAAGGASVLDWGCACGDGVDVLSREFPRCRVRGLDFAQRAIAQCRRSFPHYEFLQEDEGRIPGRFDVIVCSNCLEHFERPGEIMAVQLRRCKAFYAALVPYRETPLSPGHSVSLSRASFPVRFHGFTRVAAAAIHVDRTFWNGLQLLVVYASPSYLRRRHEQQLSSLALELAAAKAELSAKDAQLSAIYLSHGWAVLQRLRQLRLCLAPRGSARERLARAGLRTLRSALLGPAWRRADHAG